MRVIQHPHAAVELREAVAWFGQRSAVLGGRFLDEIEAATAQIAQAPLRWRTVFADIRRVYVRRFPYTIFYRVKADQVQLLAFAHHRRDPHYWASRLSTP